MIELAQHIEVLLLENDCVIVPGLGGFVAHYTPAMRVEEENIFLPPTRIIGFNPQLKMNDGLLVQSYMAVYGTNFSDATKIVDKTVKELLVLLHENGKVDLTNVGELRYTIRDTYDFIPYDNKITTPYLYGFDSFEMQKLSQLEKSYVEKTIPFVNEEDKKRRFEFSIKRSYLSNAAAMIAVIALFFFLSTPIENTEVMEVNYAQLLPNDLFEKIEKQSLVITPIIVHQQTSKKKVVASQVKEIHSSEKRNITPVAVKEVKVRQQPVNATPESESKILATQAVQTDKMPYHIIIASVATEKDAEIMAKQLIEKGFSDAKAIIGEGKMRVSIQSCSTQEDAYRALGKIRQNETFQNAWVLKK